MVVYAMGTFIETTNDHPFFVSGEWLRAHELKAGMSLTLASGETTIIEKVELKLQRTLVYNFSVENNHTYTVGNHKFLVHNCGPRSDLRDNMKKAGQNMDGKHAHHILPYSMRSNKLILMAEKAGFDINDLSNGIPLDPKFHIDYEAGNFHQKYTQYISKQLDKKFNALEATGKLNPEAAKKAVEQVIGDAKKMIEDGISNGAKKLDDIIPVK